MKSIKNLINAILFGALITAALPTIAMNKQNNPTSDEIIQKNILLYINQYRQAHGLKALTLNSNMSHEATRHSQDMANHRIPFGHKYFTDRIKRLYKQIEGCRSGAENVAYNYKDTKELVRQWIGSPGHRRNIEGHYNLTGIGIARDKNGKIYYTQMFILNDNPARNQSYR